MIKDIKTTLKLAIPISLGHLGHVITGIADYTMLGHTNQLEMSAATFATSVFYPFMILGLGFAIGLTPLVAKANGAQNSPKIKALFKTGLKSNFMVGLILFLALYYTRDFLYLFQQPPEVIKVGWDYFLLISISIIPIMIFSALKQFVEGLQNTKVPMIMSLLGNAFNILLNFPLIFGFGDFEGYGILGAGIATLTARILIVVVFLLYFIFNQKLRGIIADALTQLFEFKYLNEILKIGLPISVYMFFEVTAFSGATFMMGWISEAHIAAHQIALSLASMSFVLCLGVGNAASIRTATYLGENKRYKIKGVYQSVVLISLGLSTLSILTFVIFQESLPYFFVDQSAVEIASIASTLLIYAALFQFSDGLQVIFQGLLQGLGDVKVPSSIAIGSYWDTRPKKCVLE